jgi:hypothetical protein
VRVTHGRGATPNACEPLDQAGRHGELGANVLDGDAQA